jgi:DNA-binding MarR family transcriptional regulator
MTTRIAAAVGGSAKLDEWAVLSVLADDLGHSMGQIAELTHTLPPTLSKLVDRMASSGLVYRRTDPVDRRRVLAFATARGRREHRRLQTLIGAAVADLSDDDQLRELMRALQRSVVLQPEPVAVRSEVV